MMKKYLIILIFFTIFVSSGLALTKGNGNDETISKVHVQDAIAEHVPSMNNFKENSRRRRDEPDVKTFLGLDEISQYKVLQNYAVKHDSHRGGDRKPSVDFDTVLEETVPFNSTDYA